jgi:hypothetical protein
MLHILLQTTKGTRFVITILVLFFITIIFHPRYIRQDIVVLHFRFIMLNFILVISIVGFIGVTRWGPISTLSQAV